MFLIEGKLHSELLELVRLNAPREVGGIIVDGRRIVVLQNYAKGNSAFEFQLWELRLTLDTMGMKAAGGAEIADRVILWHSHPGGGVGPSREDMRNKTPLKHHLVIAYVNDDIVPTWY